MGRPDPRNQPPSVPRLNNPGTKGNVVVSKKMVGMRRQFLLACLCALLSAANISAQSVPPAQSMLLPDRFASWETGKQPPYVMWPRSEAAARLDSHPEYTKLLVESGVVRVEEHGYQRGNSEFGIRLFKLRD